MTAALSKRRHRSQAYVNSRQHGLLLEGNLARNLVRSNEEKHRNIHPISALPMQATAHTRTETNSRKYIRGLGAACREAFMRLPPGVPCLEPDSSPISRACAGRSARIPGTSDTACAAAQYLSCFRHGHCVLSRFSHVFTCGHCKSSSGYRGAAKTLVWSICIWIVSSGARLSAYLLLLHRSGVIAVYSSIMKSCRKNNCNLSPVAI